MEVLSYPFLVVWFWYGQFPQTLFRVFLSFTFYCINLLSLPLLILSFFRPLKNEYRKDLVVFSIVAGIIVKSALIFVSTIIILIVITVEVLLFLLYLVFPILPIILIQ